MRKLNNKGFAISTIFYSILTIAILVMGMLYSTLVFRKKSQTDFVESINEMTKISDKSKPCKVTSSYMGTRVISCDTEEFYVISSTDTMITMLSKKCLNIGSTLIYQDENNNCTEKIFTSNSIYWASNGKDLLPQYGTSYPAYVYDSNSDLYSGVQNYQRFLKEEIGIKSVTASIMSKETAEKLGSTNTTAGKEWLKGFKFWLGTAVGPEGTSNGGYAPSLYYITSEGKISTQSLGTPNTYVRPIINVSKVDIEGY